LGLVVASAASAVGLAAQKDKAFTKTVEDLIADALAATGVKAKAPELTPEQKRAAAEQAKLAKYVAEEKAKAAQKAAQKAQDAKQAAEKVAAETASEQPVEVPGSSAEKKADESSAEEAQAAKEAMEALEVRKQAEADARAEEAKQAEAAKAALAEKANAEKKAAEEAAAEEMKAAAAAATAAKAAAQQEAKDDGLAALQAELKSLDEAAKVARFESIERVLQDIELRERSLKRDLDALTTGAAEGSGELAGLSDLEVAGRVKQLASELETRSTWEALRLQQLLQLVEDNAAKHHLPIFQDQEQRAARARQKAIKMVEIEAKAKEQSALAAMEVALRADLAAALEAKLEEDQNRAKQKAKEMRDAKEAESRLRLASEVDLLGAALSKLSDPKEEKLDALHKAVNDAEEAYQKLATWEQSSVELRAMNSAIIRLADALDSPAPCGSAVSSLGKMSDPLASAAAASLARAGAGEGFPTLGQLKAKYEARVKTAAAATVYLPAGHAGASGRLVGALRARLPSHVLGVPLPSLGPAVMAQEKAQAEAEQAAKLDQVSASLAAGDLSSAVAAASSVEGAAGAALKDWVSDAKARLAADQAVALLAAHGSILNNRFVA